LDDDGSFGNGTTNISPASATSTPLGNGYSTVIATPSAVATTYTLTLPSATANPRRIYTIVYNGNALGTIDVTSPVAGSIIQNGAAVSPFALTSGAVTFQSDGTNWDVTSANSTSANAGPYFQTGSIGYITAGTYAWVVPAGITQVEVYLVGGGGGAPSFDAIGGSGGAVTGILAVTPGQTLSITVGAGGTKGATAANGVGGGGGGTYITNSTPTLLCGAGGGGGAAGSNYYETISAANYYADGFGGGAWYSNTIASLAGGTAVASLGAASGPGGANYTGYLTNAQSYKGEGWLNNPTSGASFGSAWLGGYSPGFLTALAALTTNGAALSTVSTPTGSAPTAGWGADGNGTTNLQVGSAGAAVLIW
jgi:hypothetical protein